MLVVRMMSTNPSQLVVERETKVEVRIENELVPVYKGGSLMLLIVKKVIIDIIGD